jgi:hypothetical protein
VHAPDRAAAVGDALAQRADELAVQLGHGVAHGVGDVDRGGALGDHGLEHAAQEVGVAAVAVLGTELDVVAVLPREAHRQLRLLEHLLARHAQLLLHVQLAGGDEGVDARAGRPLQRLGGAADVAVVGARQRAHRAVLDGLRDGAHRLEIAIAAGGEAGLDDVDLQPLELPRDAQLLVARHRGAGALLAVAQRGVEDDELVGHGRAFASGFGAHAASGRGSKTNGPLLCAGGPLIGEDGAVVRVGTVAYDQGSRSAVPSSSDGIRIDDTVGM